MNQSSSRTSVNDIHTSPNEEDKTSPEWLFEQSQFDSVNTGNTERYFISLGKRDWVRKSVFMKHCYWEKYVEFKLFYLI